MIIGIGVHILKNFGIKNDIVNVAVVILLAVSVFNFIPKEILNIKDYV